MYIETGNTTLNLNASLQNIAYQDPLPNEYDDDHDGTKANDDKVRDEDDVDDGDVNGPAVQAHVELAKVPCKYCMTVSEVY